MAKVAENSALLELLDNNDDEVMTTQDPKEETFIDMDHDTDQLLAPDDSNAEGERKNQSVFSLDYYIKLFDVDTDEIIQRLSWAMLPRPQFTTNFAKKTIKAKPDLYGPFWISVTLIFSVAIAGNVASYFQMTKDSHWHYDFHKVTISALIVFLYVALMPMGIFAALWTSSPGEAGSKPCFMELACICGYSLAPFLPASLLWLVQISILQWTLVLLCFGLSGGLLTLALWPLIEQCSQAKSKSYSLIVIILVLNLLLAAGFMLCFYHVPSSNSASAPVNNIIVNNTVAVQHEGAKREAFSPVNSVISTIKSLPKVSPNTTLRVKLK